MGEGEYDRILARAWGQVSEVGERQREQMLERAQARELVAAEERVAMRERRELARELKGEDLERVVSVLEADRRQQLEHAQAAAERRIERRQAQGVGRRLLDQARALRQRLGQELTRVKEWVKERIIEPAGQLKDKALEVLKSRGREAAQMWRTTLYERQQTLEREAREKVLREKTVERFQELLVSRSKGRSGFTDLSSEWRETPETLRKAIDRFRELSPAAQTRELARFAQEPERVRALSQLMNLRRERVRSLDRGQEL